MISSKSGGRKRRGDRGAAPTPDDHFFTLHQRLQHSLRLGIRDGADTQKRWQCMDAELQRLAVRSISAYLSYISTELLTLPLVQTAEITGFASSVVLDFVVTNMHLVFPLGNSISDVVVALEGILESGNQTVVSSAADMSIKLVDLLGDSIFKYGGSVLLYPLSCLISSQSSSVVISCTIALNKVLKRLKPWRANDHKGAWMELERAHAIDRILNALLEYLTSMQKPREHFTETVSLLCTMLWWWWDSRYVVWMWSCHNLTSKLHILCKGPDHMLSTVILQLYSSLALCGDIAARLCESRELLAALVFCMEKSQPPTVRIEAFRVFQMLTKSEKEAIAIIEQYCVPIIRSITSAMMEWRSLSSQRIPSDQFPLVLEACRAALIVRWCDIHHIQLWKLGIDKILFLLLIDRHSGVDKPWEVPCCLDPSETKSTGAACDPKLRSLLWDILGWLAIHCDENSSLPFGRDSGYLNGLISYSCSVAVNIFHKSGCNPHDYLVQEPEVEATARTLNLLLFSPCKYVSSLTQQFLSEFSRPYGCELVQILTHSLGLAINCSLTAKSDQLRAVLTLMGFVCYSGLSQYCDWMEQYRGAQLLFSFIQKLLKRDLKIPRSAFASHIINQHDMRTCCKDHKEDWEGPDTILFFAVWAFVGILRNSNFVYEINKKGEAEDICHLFLEVVSATEIGSGVRWFSAKILSCLGVYGYPTKLGTRVGSLLDHNVDYVTLVHSNGKKLKAHAVILASRCPSLLAHFRVSDKKGISDESSIDELEKLCRNFREVVHLSPKVCVFCMEKLLEFVYMGFVQVEDDHVKHLKTLAKHLKLQSLVLLFSDEKVKWGGPVGSCNFSSALESAGHPFCDIVLLPRESVGETSSCNLCQDRALHLHAHRIILLASCDYLRALFQSGMQDSSSAKITVPVCWEALVRLLQWFYSGVMPVPYIGCLWKNMAGEQQLQEMQIYIELSWLAELWLLPDVQECCYGVIKSCLMSNSSLGLTISRIASGFAQWNIVEISADCIAPLYPKMRNQGELDGLEEPLLEAIQSAHARLSFNHVA